MMFISLSDTYTEYYKSQTLKRQVFFSKTGNYFHFPLHFFSVTKPLPVTDSDPQSIISAITCRQSPGSGDQAVVQVNKGASATGGVVTSVAGVRQTGAQRKFDGCGKRALPQVTFSAGQVLQRNFATYVNRDPDLVT